MNRGASRLLLEAGVDSGKNGSGGARRLARDADLFVSRHCECFLEMQRSRVELVETG